MHINNNRENKMDSFLKVSKNIYFKKISTVKFLKNLKGWQENHLQQAHLHTLPFQFKSKFLN